MTISIISATASTGTSTGVADGIDVSFIAQIGDVELHGVATLLPHEDGRRGYGAWGSPDHWLDGRTLGALTAILPWDGFRDALDAIEAACAAVIS